MEQASREILKMDKRICDILEDARWTAYLDGRYGHQPYRIGNIEFAQSLARIIQEMKPLNTEG